MIDPHEDIAVELLLVGNKVDRYEYFLLYRRFCTEKVC